MLSRVCHTNHHLSTISFTPPSPVSSLKLSFNFLPFLSLHSPYKPSQPHLISQSSNLSTINFKLKTTFLCNSQIPSSSFGVSSLSSCFNFATNTMNRNSVNVKEFEEAAFSAPLNKVVRCKTKFGWHLLQVIQGRFDYFEIQRFGILSYSTGSKNKNPKSKPHKPQNKQTNSKKDDNETLFSDITEILGSGNLVVDKPLSGFSVAGTNGVILSDVGHCTQSVRGNAQEKSEGESEEKSVMGDAHVGNLTGIDVSDVVHRITEIVRGDHGGVSMEERLVDAGFEMNCEIVAKVLKRCFKVPNLATRFHDWVKLKNVNCLSSESYNTMLYMAGDIKDFELVERLLEEMGKYDCEKDVKTWTIILMHYGKANLIGKALLIFEKMRKSGVEPDAESYIMLIQLLCKCKKGEIVVEFYKEMVQKGFELDNKLYPMLLKCLAGCGDTDGVYIVANDMINVSHIPEHDVYSSVLKNFCITGRIKEALELIRDLNKRNVILSPQFFETLVKGLCKAGKMDDAQEIVDIMKKRNVVNDVVYGALINGYLRRKETSRALDLFQGMKEAGFTPLTSTYTELMQHYFNLDAYEKGCALYNELLETGVKLDTVAYTAMLAGHVRHGDISAAWKLLESMKDEGITPTQKCYSIFIKELCRSSRSDEIIKVMNHLLDSKINTGKDISHCVITYLARKKDIAKLKQVKKMLTEFRPSCEVEASQDDSLKGGIQNLGPVTVESNVECLSLEPLPQDYRDEDLHDICTILSSDKEWSSIQEALEKLKICYTPTLVFEILRICSLYGSAVLHFFSWVRKQPGYRHTTETYNMAVKIAGKGKDFKHMRYIFSEMQRNGCSVTSDTWTIMIMLYGRVGLTEIALKIFSEMKASGCQPTASAYKYLMLSLCRRKGRKVDEAIRLFKEMITAGLVPDKELVEVCFDCFCQAGMLAEAKKCLEFLKNIGFSTPLSYSLLIRALCRRGNLEEALALANDVKEDRSTLDHYVSGSLVHGLLMKGRLDEALSKIECMKHAGIHPTVHVYTSLITHYCKEKHIGKAMDIFKTMWDEGCHPTVVTYTALIHGYISMGNFEDARKLFLRMRLKGPFPDFRAYSMLIASFCEKGRSEDALQFLSEMLNDGIVPSTVNFRSVFFGLNREGKQDLAQSVMRLKHAVTSKRKFVTS